MLIIISSLNAIAVVHQCFYTSIKPNRISVTADVVVGVFNIGEMLVGELVLEERIASTLSSRRWPIAGIR